MAKKKMFKTDAVFSWKEIVGASKKISDHYTVTNGFRTIGTKYAVLSDNKTLPDLWDCKGIEFEEIIITGYLRNKDAAWNLFSNIGTNDKVGLKEMAGRIALSCNFQERTSAQVSAYRASVSLIFLKGKVSFGFSTNGVAISKNPTYWEDFYRKLIQVYDLPLKINGSNIVHLKSGNLRITDIHPGYLPGGFICELPECDLGLLITKLKNGVDMFSIETSPIFSWRITFDEIEERNFGFVKLVSDFPADHYDIDLEYSVVGIEGLDYLKSWCEDDDVSITGICIFELLGYEVGGELLVETSKYGHKLLLNLPSVDKVKEIERNLGVKFNVV